MILQNLYQLEYEYWLNERLVCGVDEVGRGCLAGPVVTAVAMLHQNVFHDLLIDSKKLSPKNLLLMHDWLMNHCSFSVAIASNTTIDQHNIYKTTQMMMKQALLNLLTKENNNPDLIIIDAMPLSLENTGFENITMKSLTQAESKSASVAAASIIAKVTRDKIITRLASSFADYGFEKHKGYATALHQQSLTKFKPSIIHRQTFLKNFLTEKNHEQQSIFC